MHQEPRPTDDPATQGRSMGTDTHTTKSRAEQPLEVVRHPDERCYELLADGQFAGLIVYEDAGDHYVFTHTFIAEGFRGQGLSWPLMRGVLEDVKERHITVASLIDSGKSGRQPAA